MSIATQPFGRSGHVSTRTIFGAASLSNVTQEEADRTLEVLLRYGVNHIDVAASYGDAELRIAPWLAQHRSLFYVATKTDARTAQEAKEELQRSLERMRIDYVDLWQLHNLVDPIEWDIALSPGGAIESIAYQPWLGRKRTRDVWYEPLEEQQDIDLAVHWVLKRPGIFLNTVGDIHLLPKVLDAASRWQEGSAAPTDEQMQALATRLGMVPLFV